MRIYRHAAEIPPRGERAVAAFGVFDGVHLGHVKIISTAVSEARRRAASCAVITFNRHPREITEHKAPDFLMTLSHRLEHIGALGVDVCLVLDFTPAFAATTAEEFVRRYVVELFGAAAVVIGRTQRFGASRLGDCALMRELGRRAGFETLVVEPVQVDGLVISSSLIRQRVAQGDLPGAARMLGRSYIIEATVVRVEKRAGTLRVFLDPHNEAVPAQGRFEALIIRGRDQGRAVATKQANADCLEIECPNDFPVDVGHDLRVELGRRCGEGSNPGPFDSL